MCVRATVYDLKIKIEKVIWCYVLCVMWSKGIWCKYYEMGMSMPGYFEDGKNVYEVGLYIDK